MPTPSTRTPVRIARGSFSNLNGSISDLQDGEISYAEDQNKLYVKEGSSLVALTFPPADPAFTGTITGVNLTLSGNLTVNGTTTTINTQTLDVEDKQIEIGKVSSPSDTTADQGGWKLKGATDKTFLWVNATDAWTSSEHIHLGDNKKLLLGTGSDLEISHDGSTNIINAANSNAISFRRGGSEQFFIGNSEFKGGDNKKIKLGVGDDIQIYHDGSNSYLQNGTGTLFVRAKTTETGIAVVPDGAVELYHNNVKKAETTAAGVTVTGTVTDSNGDVRKIPYSTKTSAYTLVEADGGKVIHISSGGVTVPASVLIDGYAVTIINNSGSDQTITQGSGMTIYNTADAATGNRTLAGRGMATLYVVSSSVCYISGAGLS
tara:strand:- start:21 stop:1148 length:1128 start_codon:yes stop_codon:yes gene_type:complete